MEFLYVYVIFAVATGVTSYFTLYRPTLARLESEYDLEADNPFINAIQYIVLSTLTAPVVLIQTLRGCTEDYFKEILESIENDGEED